MPSRWSRRAALPIGLLGGGWLLVSLIPSDDRDFPAPAVESAAEGRLADRLTCTLVGGDAWSQLPGVDYTGWLVLDLPAAPRGAIVLLVADRVALDIRARSADGPFPIERESLRPGSGIGIPSDLWMEAGGPWGLPPVIERVTVPSLGHRAVTVELSLGRRAPTVLARWAGHAASRATVCAAPPPARPHRAGAVLEVLPDAHGYFATGWYGDERGDDQRAVRWMGDVGALLVPSDDEGSVRVQLRAAPPQPEREEPPWVSLRVNDVWGGPALRMAAAAADYEWRVPAGAWVAGVNELLFTVSHAPIPESGGRRRGLALHAVRVAP